MSTFYSRVQAERKHSVSTGMRNLLAQQKLTDVYQGFHNPRLPMCFVWPAYDFYNTVATCMMKNSYISENTFWKRRQHLTIPVAVSNFQLRA
jgi:hypothetical protein